MGNIETKMIPLSVKDIYNLGPDKNSCDIKYDASSEIVPQLASIIFDLKASAEPKVQSFGIVNHNGTKIKSSPAGSCRISLDKATYGTGQGGLIYTGSSFNKHNNGAVAVKSLMDNKSLVNGGVMSLNYETDLMSPKSKSKASSPGMSTDDLIKNRLKAEAAKKMKTTEKLMKFFPTLCFSIKFSL